MRELSTTDRSTKEKESKTMIRLIKRYESRKLYDTEESRYVSLDEIAAWIRGGQEVRVVDNATNSDVTSQTLTQIILEEGRKGTSLLPSDLLHELVRRGERAVATGVEQVTSGVDRLMQASFDRLGPVRRAREEMGRLRNRLEELEASLTRLETEVPAEEPKSAGSKSRTSGSRKTAAKKTTAKSGGSRKRSSSSAKGGKKTS
jgi:polyhydroxyalkanoate synthesis repressor PhaR